MSEVKATNPKEFVGSTKAPLHLWPLVATVWGSLALLAGALKYGRMNWRVAGVRASTYKSAMDRHLGAWFEGEWTDPETALPHLAHVLACAAILLDAYAAGKVVDDVQYHAHRPGDVCAPTATLYDAPGYVEFLKGKLSRPEGAEPQHYDGTIVVYPGREEDDEA